MNKLAFSLLRQRLYLASCFFSFWAILMLDKSDMLIRKHYIWRTEPTAYEKCAIERGLNQTMGCAFNPAWYFPPLISLVAKHQLGLFYSYPVETSRISPLE